MTQGALFDGLGDDGRCPHGLSGYCQACAAPRDGHRDGATYTAAFDYDRLNQQMKDVWRVVGDHRWRTLRQIAEGSGHPEASVSARLRDLRKRKFGAHVVERERDTATPGLFWYRVGDPTCSGDDG